MLLAPTKYTLPLTQKFYTCLSTLHSCYIDRSSHAPTFHYAFLSLQTNSGTRYTAAVTDGFSGWPSVEVPEAFVLSSAHSSVHIATPTLAIRHSYSPQVRCLSAFLPPIIRLSHPHSLLRVLHCT